ncbi:fibroleukin-like [Styela clava]
MLLESQRFDRKKKFVIAGLILLLVLVIIVVPVTLRFSQADLIKDFPSDCTNLTLSNAKASSATGGVFDIYPESKENPIRVYCDLHTDGGGWIVFQRRYDGSTNFNRKRKDYVNGFGEPDKEMWLGLETIHRLTKNGVHELRVDLEDFSGNVRYAKYSVFHIASETHTYRLKVIGYSGTAGDALEMHSDRVFSTEEDNIPGENCGTPYYGGYYFSMLIVRLTLECLLEIVFLIIGYGQFSTKCK